MLRETLRDLLGRATDESTAETAIRRAESTADIDDRVVYTDAELRELCRTITDQQDGPLTETAADLRTSHSTESFERLLETIPEPAVVVDCGDAEPLVRRANSTFAAVFGVHAAEARGQPLAAVVGSEGVDTLPSTWSETDSPTETTLTRRTVDGSERTFRLRVTAEPTAGGTTVGYGVYTDISECETYRTELDEITDQVEMAGQIAQLSFWEYDVVADELRYLHQGGSVGLDPDEQASSYAEYQTAVHPADLDSFIDNWEANLYGDAERYESEHRVGEGDELTWVRDVGRVVERGADGEPIRSIGVEMDITTIKTREQTLKRQNERLDQFASIISHDLRNPLGIAEMYLDFARDSGDGADFDAVEEALQRMDDMIDDLLTMARTEAKSTDTELLKLHWIADRAWSTVRPEHADLTVELPTDYTVDGNPDLLLNVFENLFRNAAEHAATPDDPATVLVGQLDGDCGFYIEDDGEGVPEASREQMFEHGYTTSDDGSGFGLSIVSDICEVHDWTIAVTDGRDGGARFEIRTVV